MEYQPSVESSESLQVNTSSLMKYVAMIIPTPSKVEITGKIIFSKTIEIEYEDQESAKRQKWIQAKK